MKEEPTDHDAIFSDEEPETPHGQTYIFDGVSYHTYQEMVDAKRKRNEQILQGLGFLDTGGAPRLESNRKAATQRGIKRQKSKTEPLPRRKSSRLSSEKENLVALDYYVNDWNRNNSVVNVEGNGTGFDAKDAEPQKPDYPKGRLNDGDDMKVKDAVEMMDEKWINDDSVELAEQFVQKTLANLCGEKLEIPSSKRTSPTSVTATSLETDLASMVKSLSIDNQECVAKVTPERIYSVAAHPSENKLIACAGDKLGYIGLWDVDAPVDDSRNGVHLFRVHSRPICCLEWATDDSMISASYDGTIRRLNVETGTFEEIFASYDDSNTYYAEELGFGIDEGYSFWHQHVSLDHRFAGSDPCLFLATSVGTALHLDLRLAERQRITFNEQLSERKINTLSLHLNGYTLVSAGNDGIVSLWDIRKFGKAASQKAVATQHVGRSVSSAYFSPSGGSLLSTSFEDRIDLIDGAHTFKGVIKPSTSIKHNNQTGRWLSTFMPCWHPKQDIFVSGSMKKPRCIEIFDHKGKLLREVSGDTLTAVASRCCFHPSTKKVVVIGGNSSGRVVAVR